jgi:hypothetical protein
VTPAFGDHHGAWCQHTKSSSSLQKKLGVNSKFGLRLKKKPDVN